MGFLYDCTNPPPPRLSCTRRPVDHRFNLAPAAMTRTALLLAAGLGFLAVLAGTFGAHGLEGRVDPRDLPIYETGVRYLMFHALALLAAASTLPRLGRAGAVVLVLWPVGSLIFFGTLAGLTLTGLRWLGAVTPLGGLCLLLGWIALAVGAWRHAKPAIVGDR